MNEREFYAKKIRWMMQYASEKTLRRVYNILCKLIEMEGRK